MLSLISRIVRNYFLPDPFEMFEEQFLIELLSLECIPVVIAYETVGLFYERGSAPVFGVISFFVVNFMYGCLISSLASIGAPLWLTSTSPLIVYLLLSKLKYSIT